MENFTLFNEVLPHSRRETSRRFYDPDYKLHFCAIPKNMSTMMKLLFCDIMMLRRHTKIHYWRPYSECEQRHPDWSYRNEFNNGPGWMNKNRKLWDFLTMFQQKSQKFKKDINFVIVRDPVERFVSAYGDYCTKWKFCGKSGQSVHSMAPAAFQLLSTGNHKERLEKRKKAELVRHFAPQNWFCHVGDKNAKTNLRILRYSNDQAANVRMVDNIFAEAGMSAWYRRQVLIRMQTTRTRNANLNKTQAEKWINEIYSNQETLLWIMKLYYWDYVLLDYPFPEVEHFYL